MAVPVATLGPLVLKSDTLGFYYVCLALAFVMTWLAVNIVKSRTGRAFMALRESEIAAQTNGIDLSKYKTIAFALSAFYTGMAGALYAQAVTFIAPDGLPFSCRLNFSRSSSSAAWGQFWARFSALLPSSSCKRVLPSCHPSGAPR